MENRVVYPGSFCPPTYGHLRIVERAAEIFPKIYVVCSVSHEKDHRWFSLPECAAMWQSYKMPANVEIRTFNDMATSVENKRGRDIVMVRGIRNRDDLEYEKEVVMLNKERYGIDKFFYLFSECSLEHVSSSLARSAAEQVDLEKLHNLVSPMIVAKLLEKTLGIKNIFLVVGKPASGKSTFLKMLTDIDKNNVHINTDVFADNLKPLIYQHFGDQVDLIDLAVKHDRDLVNVIKQPWIKMLAEALKSTTPGNNVFVEIPYGMQENKRSYRYAGGKILYIGCRDEFENQRRIRDRHTLEHQPFVSSIPGLEKTKQIADEHKLILTTVFSDGTIEQLFNRAIEFNAKIN